MATRAWKKQPVESMTNQVMNKPRSDKLERIIAVAAIAGIAVHLGLRFGTAFGSDLYSVSLHTRLAGAAGVYQGDFAYRFVLDQLISVVSAPRQ